MTYSISLGTALPDLLLVEYSGKAVQFNTEKLDSIG